MSNPNMSMGALFNERRRQKQQQSSPPPQRQQQQQPMPSSVEGGGGRAETVTKRPSFLEIQAEQEKEESVKREQLHQSHQVRRGGGGGQRSHGGRRYDDFGGYGGGGGGGGYGGGPPRGGGGGGSGGYGAPGGGRDHPYNRGGGGMRDDSYGPPRGGGERGGRERYNNKGGGDTSSLPTEQGSVATLLDKFGFIRCAARPIELFFHPSELRGLSYADLNVGDEVSFGVGPASSFSRRGGDRNNAVDEDGEEKLAAYGVRVLEPGTVVWEVEDEPGMRCKGRVEKVCRPGGGGREREGPGEGTIRLLSSEDKEGDDDGGDDDDGEKTVVHYASADYSPPPKPSSYSRADSAISSSSQRSSSSQTSASASFSTRLGRNDLVEFNLVTSLRSGTKYARAITLVESERERLRLLREKELMANATLEQGVVSSMKGEYGFLRSCKRREEVYFHFSNVVFPQPEGGGDGGEGRGGGALREGQEVEFWVVNEDSIAQGGVGRGTRHQGSSSSGGGGGGPKGNRGLSAREVKFLPAGSVEFHRVLAEGVAGVVSVCPRPAVEPPLGGGGGGGGRGSGGEVGKVRLLKPVAAPTEEEEEGGERSSGTTWVTEAFFHPTDSPGGSFASNRDGSQVGLWVREGDTVLFDVVLDSVDGMYWVAPTRHLRPFSQEKGNEERGTMRAEEEAKSAGDDDNSEGTNKEKTDGNDGGTTKGKSKTKKKPLVPSVRLISPTPAGRAEGTISAVRDNYGFIHCAERPVDAYFRLYEFFPRDMQSDLRRNDPKDAANDDIDVDFNVQKLAVGTEVSFDLSLQGMVQSGPGGSGHRGGGGKAGRNHHHHGHGNNERENLKAQRIAILPPGAMVQTKVLATGVRGIVNREDPRQPYAGYVELDDTVKGMSVEERHPFVSRLVKSMLERLDVDEGKGEGEEVKVVFHDVQSPKDEAVIVSIVEGLSGGRLVCGHVGEGGVAGGHPGRLCITPADKAIAQAPKEQEDSTAAATVRAGGGESNASAATVASSDTASAGETEIATDNNAPTTEETTAPPPPHTTKQSKKKKKKDQTKVKSVKMMRYDKHCLVPELHGLMPPGKDDVVTCDVLQSRRTGVITLGNVKVVERKMLERGVAVPGSATSEGRAATNGATGGGVEGGGCGSGVGIVTEVVPVRQFGFISLLDENATRREVLFFHMSSVVAARGEGGFGEETASFAAVGEGGEGGGSSPKQNRSGGGNKVVDIRKGDEVKFDITVSAKNGKRIAHNITVVPHGTLNLPSKADRNACRGYVLMEPSHTSLANTPSHSTHGVAPTAPSKAVGGGGGRWDNVGKQEKLLSDAAAASGSNVKEEGRILLLSDPANLFGTRTVEKNKKGNSDPATTTAPDGSTDDKADKPDEEQGPENHREAREDGKENSIREGGGNGTATAPTSTGETDGAAPTTVPLVAVSAVGTHLPYKSGAIALQGPGSSSSISADIGGGRGGAAPRRGDLVSFVKTKAGRGVRDIRVMKAGAATLVRGRLEGVAVGGGGGEGKEKKKNGEGGAKFVADRDGKVYDIDLREIVSCDVLLIKERESVEGILHEGKIYGVCRTTDLYLESKITKGSMGKKERPRLNLTVKNELKGLGGKIMAQSGMAKGPDGTNGFVKGWTKRISQYVVVETEGESSETVEGGTKQEGDSTPPSQEEA